MNPDVHKIEAHEINWYVAYDALRKSVELAKTPQNARGGSAPSEMIASHMEDALASLEGVVAKPDSEVASIIDKVRERLQIVMEAPERFLHAPGADELEAFCLSLRDALPDFRVVLLDESREPGSGKVEGNVYSAYLYDARRPVFMAEIKPSFELRLVGTFASPDLPEEVRWDIEAESREQSIYMHTSSVASIRWNMKYVCGEPNVLDGETYEDLVEAMVEQLRCNVVMDAPCPLTESRTLTFVKRLEAIGANEDAEALLDTLNPAIKKIVFDNPSFARGIDDAIDGLRILQTDIGHGSVRAARASQFMDELLSAYGSLGAIVDRHGAGALVDSMYLQNAILTGSIATFGASSELPKIMSELPSKDHWQVHAASVDRYNELVPHDVGPTASSFEM